MAFLGCLKSMLSPPKSTNMDQSALRRKETKTFEWITPFDTTTAGQVTYAFEIGQKIGFPTIWAFSMRPVKVKTRSYIGLTVSLLQHPNKAHEHSTKIWASFSTELQRPDPLGKGFVTSTEAEDFGTRSIKGMMNYFDLANLHLYRFPDKKLRITIKFTLFAPLPITKLEIRQKAAKRCDSDILKQLWKTDFTDALVKVDDGREFRAYRIALARSPYFKELLSEQAKSADGERQLLPIVLQVNKPFEIMKIIICFIHYGHLLDELLDTKNYTLDFAKYLVEAAEEFGLPDLAEFLWEFYPGLKPTDVDMPEPKKMEINEEKDKLATEEKLDPMPVAQKIE